MSAPFGFSAGDFITVGTFAWTVYKSCKAAPENFGNISKEVLSLHALIKEAEETLFVRPLHANRRTRQKTVCDGCNGVLKDLEELVNRYESLGTQSKRTWDRMKWAQEDIAEIRARIVSHTTMLTAFMSTSQAHVEKKLDNLLREFRRGKHEGSAMTTETLDSLSTNGRGAWTEIRRNLKAIGITVAAFDANKDFIFDWFARALASGAFEERNPDSPLGQPAEVATPLSFPPECLPIAWTLDFQETLMSNLNFGGKRDRLSVSQDDSSLEDPTQADPSFPCASLRFSRTNPNATVSGPAFEQPYGSGKPGSSGQRPKVSSIGAMLARLTRPKKHLIKCIDRKDTDGIARILDSSSFLDHLGDSDLYNALCHAAKLDHYGAIDVLTERGVPINTSKPELSALCVAVTCGHEDMVRRLVDRGADVNHITVPNDDSWNIISSRDLNSSILRKALSFSSDLFLPTTLSCNIMRLLLSANANPGAELKHKIIGTFVTVLHQAAERGSAGHVQLLIANGIDIDTGSPYGSPLMFALASGRTDSLVDMLLDYGANANYECQHPYYPNVCNPLDAAVVGGVEKHVISLLARGARPTERTLSLVGGLMRDRISFEPVVFFYSRLDWTTAQSSKYACTGYLRIRKLLKGIYRDTAKSLGRAQT